MGRGALDNDTVYELGFLDMLVLDCQIVPSICVVWGSLSFAFFPIVLRLKNHIRIRIHN